MKSYGFGYGLTIKSSSVAASSPAPAPTPVAGDITAARIAPSGWVLELDVLGFKPGGNVGRGRNGTGAYPGTGSFTVQYDLGFASTPKITLSIGNRSGYTSAGAPSSSLTGTSLGTVSLRRAYTVGGAEQTNDETDNGTYTTIRLALSSRVYPGETVTLSALADLYRDNGPGGSGAPSRAASGLVVTNNAAAAQVKPICGYLTPARQRLTGDFTFEAFAAHELGQQGRTVAAVVMSWTGATSGYSVTSSPITEMTLSSYLNPAVGERVPVYKATLTSAQLANFTQGETINWSFEARPFVGPSFNSVTDGEQFPTANVAYALPFICDKNNALRAFASVDPAGTLTHTGSAGSTLGCTLADQEQTATTSCYASIQDAANALHSFMGRSELSGGQIYIRAGTYTSLSGAGSSTSSARPSGLGWLTLQPAPSTNRESVTLIPTAGQSLTGSVRRMGGHLRVKNLTLLGLASASANDNVIFNGPDSSITVAATRAVWIDDCVVTSQSTATSPSAMISGFGQGYWTNNTISFTTRNDPTFKTSSGRGFYLLASNSISRSAVIVHGPVMGNRCTNNTTFENMSYVASAPTNFTHANQVLWCFNSTVASQPCTPGWTGGGQPPYVKGVAWIGNMVENFGSSSQAAGALSNDSDVTELPNAVMAYNTIVGQRTNTFYNDAGTVGIPKRGTRWFNVFNANFIKRDTFSHPTNGKQAARTGNWACSHLVDSYGNVTLETQFGFSLASPDSDLGDFWPGGKTVAPLSIFTDYKGGFTGGNLSTSAATSSGGGTGGGDYHLVGTGDNANGAYNCVPTGLAMLPFDRDGVTRLNNGKGAAGVYERRDIAA